MKTLFTNLFALLPMTFAGAASSAELNASATLSKSQRSYDLEMENPTDAEMLCKTIEVQLTVGKAGCKDSRKSVSDTWKNLKFKRSGKVVDTNYGLEVLSRLNDAGYVFCGEPRFSFNCETLD